jgi:hypothetical protein
LRNIGAAEATISKAAAIRSRLLLRWIDGQLGKFDEHFYVIRKERPAAGQQHRALSFLDNSRQQAARTLPKKGKIIGRASRISRRVKAMPQLAAIVGDSCRKRTPIKAASSNIKLGTNGCVATRSFCQTRARFGHM